MATTETSPGRHSAVAVWSALLLASALAWAAVVAYAATMPMGMDAGGMVPQPAASGFLGVWVFMMAAMMLPSVAPVATIYAKSLGASVPGAAQAGRVAGLVAGYLLVWAAYGIVAFAATRAFAALSGQSGQAAVWIDAAALAVAGAYQFTPAKNRCLSHCRSPMAVLLHIGNFRGKLRDVRAGLWHGSYCLGCCWSLMLVLVAVGMMNIVWMVLLAVVVFVEKTWRYGRQFSYGIGVLLLVLAFAVPFQPVFVGMSGM